jgi:hypothetical protein
MSGILYLAGFQVGGANTMTLSTLGTGATVAAGYYMQGQDTSTASYAQEEPDVTSWTGQQYTAFSAAVKTAFDAATGATWTVNFDETAGLFGLSKTGGAVALTFSTAADLRLRAALGFASDQGAATSFQATVVPHYAMFSVISGRTDVQGAVEEDDMAEESVSDGGVDYVITRKTRADLISWKQAMEPRSSVYPFARRTSSTPLAWTWQEWFRHCRGTHPFLVVDALEGEPAGAYYRYTAKGASHRPQRVAADYDDYWLIPHEARWLARREPA